MKNTRELRPAGLRSRSRALILDNKGDIIKLIRVALLHWTQPGWKHRRLVPLMLCLFHPWWCHQETSRQCPQDALILGIYTGMGERKRGATLCNVIVLIQTYLRQAFMALGAPILGLLYHAIILRRTRVGSHQSQYLFGVLKIWRYFNVLSIDLSKITQIIYVLCVSGWFKNPFRLLPGYAADVFSR